jgi:hypothetical protein
MIMRHSIKISMMALVAMFAVSTTADAQFGKLLKKAKSAVMGSSSQDAYWEQQKKNEEMLKAQQAKNEAELQEKLKQVGTKPYDANAELPKSPVARTIYTDPNTGEKMMLDLKSTSGDRTISGFWSVAALEKEDYLTWQLKPEALDKAVVEKLFEKKFGGITSAANASSTRTDSKYGHKFKVGNIGTETPSWKYRRDDWGNMTCRYVVLMVVMEFDDGENIIGRFEAKQDHISGDSFDVDGTSVGFVNGNINNTTQRVINGWEVRTDCFTSTLANK